MSAHIPASPVAAPARGTGHLRRRILASYALLIGVCLLLSSLISLLLFARRAGLDAERELSDQAATLANVVETLALAGPLEPPELLARLFADARLRASGQPILVLDAAGRPLFDLRPPPRPFRMRDGLGPGARFGPGLRPGEQELRFPPLTPNADNRPATGLLAPAARRRLLYATVPLPRPLGPSFAALQPGEPGSAEPAFLALFRPRLNLAGALQGMFSSVMLAGTLALLLASLLAVALARSITRPLAELTAATVRVAAGDYAARVRPAGDGELERLGAAFNQMAARVQEADIRQREFVANVSHDLRTPLTTVRGFARALVDGTARTEDQRQRAAAAIDAASERMAGLVESLLDLARLEGRSATGALKLETEHLAPLLAASAAAAAGAAQAAGVDVAMDCPEDLSVRADRVWLGRAFGNVLDNALRFSPPSTRRHAAFCAPIVRTRSST
jgi:signal transduction histidine kinase